MLKFIHLTDTHLLAPGATLYGLDPAARLEQCVDAIAARHGDAEFCALTGDLAHLGEAAAYSFAVEALARLPMPVYPIPGNHDERDAFAAAFHSLHRDEHGFVQYAAEHGDAVFLMLDTLEPAEGSGGLYCEARAAWLEKAISSAGDRPVFLFMHHPPFPVGIPALDAIALGDPGPFEEVVAASNNIRHIFFGHAHRPISGHWRGISFSTLYGTSHQTRLDLVTTGACQYTTEPPAYAVALLDGDQLTLHTDHFLQDITNIRDPSLDGHQTG